MLFDLDEDEQKVVRKALEMYGIGHFAPSPAYYRVSNKFPCPHEYTQQENFCDSCGMAREP